MKDIDELITFLENYKNCDVTRIVKYIPNNCVYDSIRVSAAYIIVSNDLRIYIGSSVNVFLRITSHMLSIKKGNYRIDDILCVYILETKEYRYIENELISLLQPELNELSAQYGMVSIAIEVSEKENRQLKLLSMERDISSKALLIQKIVSEYLKRLKIENTEVILEFPKKEK